MPPSVVYPSTELGMQQQASVLPATMLASVLGLADIGPGLVVFSHSLQCFFINLQADRLMRELRQLETHRRTFGGTPNVVTRCCQDLAKTLHRYPNPRSWGRVQLVRVLGGKGNMILARFHAIPAATEPTQISIIVGLLERFSAAQHQAGMLPQANFQLTGREEACVTHLIQGMTDKEIAQQLGLSEYTVKDHFKRVRKKTGAANRTGIIARVLGRAQVQCNESLSARAQPSEQSIR